MHDIWLTRARHASTPRLEAITARAASLRERLADLAQRGETQASRIDPDARRLSKRGRSLVGYNVQTAIDSQHKLILAAELTNAGNDLGQLVPMIEHSRAALGLEDAFIAHCAERRRRREATPGAHPAEDALSPLARLASALRQALCARAGSARLGIAFPRVALSAA